jgi:hypothetical protein
MLYQAPIESSQAGYGYPSELKIYYKLKNAKGLLTDDFLLLDDIISSPSSNVVIIEFLTIIFDQIKFEWANIQVGNYAAAKEIKLFFPENKYINELMNNIYDPSDYKCLTIINKYKDITAFEDLIEKIKDYYDISENIRKAVERIKKVINGEIYYEQNREFTTNQKAKGNIIHQYGDVASYSRNILKMKYGGTNRQCTGVFGLAYETITIYVYAQEKELLPKIIFTQFHEKNTNWYSSPIQLNIGKNILKFNNFNTEDFEEKEISGGPIYIENPYTSTSQSQNIKLYIEGGKIFPLFRLNDDETEFKKILKNYILVYKKEQNNYLDIAEFYSDRAMITVKATLADEFYSSENSPQKILIY